MLRKNILWLKPEKFQRFERMRNTNEQNIKDVIREMFQGSKTESKLKEADLIQKWPTVVGEHIAKQTSKLYINNQKLYIYITSAPLRNELNYSRNKIIEVVNEHAGCELIKEVIVL